MKAELTMEPGAQEFWVSRIFDASPAHLFKITNDPELIPHWWGPRELSTIVEVMDVRPGGRWRIVQTSPDGREHGFHGVYHEVTEGERTVRTFEYEGAPGHVVLETTRYEGHDGRTRMLSHSVFQWVADRDAMLASGMEGGMTPPTSGLTS